MDYDVIIVGGGLTGAAVLRDCALRGLRPLLIEADDLASGASGCESGLLEVGAGDSQRRRRAIAELAILRKTAGALVQRVPVLWPLLDRVSSGAVERLLWQAGVADAQMPVRPRDGGHWQVLDGDQARLFEPALGERVRGAILTAAWRVNVERLCAQLVCAAREVGAEVRLRTRVTGILCQDGRVAGVIAHDLGCDQTVSLSAPVIINCTGARRPALAATAGLEVEAVIVRVAWLTTAYRSVASVLAETEGHHAGLRLVPLERQTLIGPLPTRVATVPDETCIDPEEIEAVLRAADRLVPGLSGQRMAGVRVTHRALLGTGHMLGCGSPRLPELRDHGQQGVKGLLTVQGGAVGEHRLVGEWVGGAVARMLGRTTESTTRVEPLPAGGEALPAAHWQAMFGVAADTASGLLRRHGVGVHTLLERSERAPVGMRRVCRCRGVLVGEVQHAAREELAGDLPAVGRRTGLGRGLCQGSGCLAEAAAVMAQEQTTYQHDTRVLLSVAKESRHRATRSVLSRGAAGTFAVDQLAHKLSANLGSASVGELTQEAPCD